MRPQPPRATANPPPEDPQIITPPFNGRHVVLGVSGGVAAYKAVELCRRLMDAGSRVSPVMTQSATRFVGAATFAAVASEPPRLTLWDSPEPSPHTTLGQGCDVVVVAPATARLIGSYAHGIADDLLTTTLLATRAPVVLAPAMHTEMWEHPAVQDNLALLRRRGVTVVEPESGHLAGGDVGVGRLASPDAILSAVGAALDAAASGLDGRPMRGVRVVVTAGGTREPIDPVRFIGNRSSGKQGHALAAEAVALGAEVVLVTAAGLPDVDGAHTVRIATAGELHDAVMEELPRADAVVMAAAVADFRPSLVRDRKIKKTDGIPEIRLEPTVDVLAAIAERRTAAQVIVGFAAETEAPVEHAREKLERKRLDMIVANDVTERGAGFEHDTNRAYILDKFGRLSTTSLTTKRAVAVEVWERVMRMLHGNVGENGQGASS